MPRLASTTPAALPHIQQIVGEAIAGQREFTDVDAARGVDVGGGRIADVPACRLQQHIDIPPRLLFWLWSQDTPLFVISRIFAYRAIYRLDRRMVVLAVECGWLKL